MSVISGATGLGLAAVAEAQTATQPMTTDAAAIRPFHSHFSDEAIADLRQRIAATRWPDRESVTDTTQGVQLATSNGRIVLDLPEHVDADVDIRVDNGVIRNDRELCPKGRETDGRVAGRLGLGGKLIKLRTSNGSVSLH